MTTVARTRRVLAPSFTRRAAFRETHPHSGSTRTLRRCCGRDTVGALADSENCTGSGGADDEYSTQGTSTVNAGDAVLATQQVEGESHVGGVGVGGDGSETNDGERGSIVLAYYADGRVARIDALRRQRQRQQPQQQQLTHRYQRQRSRNRSLLRLLRASPVATLFARIFLPTSYPESVATCYVPYATWHFIHNTLTACNNVLATTSLLVAAGVDGGAGAGAPPSSSSASANGVVPIGAVTSWILKDGVGNLARLFFGSRYARAFDGDLKRFRVVADILWHAGTALELSCRTFPALFLPLAAAGNTLKGMAQVVFFSTRSTIHRVVALRANIGDVTAKGDAQSISADLLGMAAGIALNNTILRSSVHGDGSSDNAAAAALVFAALVTLQMISRVRSMRVLVLPSLNFERAVLLVATYTGVIDSGDVNRHDQDGDSTGENDGDDESNDGDNECGQGDDRDATVDNECGASGARTRHPRVLTPAEVAAREHFLHVRSAWSSVPGIVPDVPLGAFGRAGSSGPARPRDKLDVADDGDDSDAARADSLTDVLHAYADEKFIVGCIARPAAPHHNRHGRGAAVRSDSIVARRGTHTASQQRRDAQRAVRIGFAMRRDATAEDCVRALLAATYLMRRTRALVRDNMNDDDDDDDGARASTHGLVRGALAYASATAPASRDLLTRARDAGWSLDTVHGFGHERRVTF